MSGMLPWILLDFDGVLNIDVGGAALESAYDRGWRLGVAFLDSGPERVCYHPEAGRWLTELATETGARLAWATMRESVANRRCSPLVGLPSLPVVPVTGRIGMGGAVTKAETVVPWTGGAPFLWFEDLDEEAETADMEAGQRHPHLVQLVDPLAGLTREDIAHGRDFLLSLRREYIPGGGPR